MTYLKLIVLTLILASCANEARKESNSVNENTEPSSVSKPRASTVDESTAEKQKESVVTVEGNIYTEYYPGNKNIKFQGPQDSEKRVSLQDGHVSCEEHTLQSVVRCELLIVS